MLVTTDGIACTSITSRHSCEEAARQLGLGNTTARDDDGNVPTSDPPYCYFEDSELYFNEYGNNTGSCSSSDQCLCIQGKNQLLPILQCFQLEG